MAARSTEEFYIGEEREAEEVHTRSGLGGEGGKPTMEETRKVSDIFPSSQPSKTLKIKTARSNSTGFPTYSPFGPPVTCFSPVLSPKLPFVDLKLT